MPIEMLKAMINILLPGDIPFFYYNREHLPVSLSPEEWHIPMDKIRNKLFPFLKMIKLFDWHYFTLICIEDNAYEDCTEFQIFTDHLLSKQYCVAYETIQGENKHHIKEVMLRLKHNVNNSVILLWGKRSAIKQFLKKSEEMDVFDRTWILFDFFVDYRLQWKSLYKNNTLGLFSIFGSERENKYSHTNMKNSDTNLDNWVEQFFRLKGIKQDENMTLLSIQNDMDKIAYQYTEDITSILFKETFLFTPHTELNIYELRDWLTYDYLEGLLFFFHCDPFTNRCYERNIEYIQYDKGFGRPEGLDLAGPNSKRNLPISKCPLYQCNPGWGNKFGHLTKNKTKWQREFGWTCQKCQENFIKEEQSYGFCKPCKGINISNTERTKCYDPYVDEYLDYDDLVTILTLSVCGIGIIFSIMVIIVFIIFRKTPCVISSDYRISLFQLSVSIIFYIGYPLIMIGKPLKETCIARPIFVGFCFSLNIAITITKVQKLLFAFKAKVRLSRNRIRITKFAQLFMISIIMLMHAAIFVVSIIQSQISVLANVMNNAYKNEVYCNSDLHMHLQICYIQKQPTDLFGEKRVRFFQE